MGKGNASYEDRRDFVEKEAASYEKASPLLARALSNGKSDKLDAGQARAIAETIMKDTEQGRTRSTRELAEEGNRRSRR